MVPGFLIGVALVTASCGSNSAPTTPTTVTTPNPRHHHRQLRLRRQHRSHRRRSRSPASCAPRTVPSWSARLCGFSMVQTRADQQGPATAAAVDSTASRRRMQICRRLQAATTSHGAACSSMGRTR